MAKIIVVEDEQSLSENIVDLLEHDHHTVDVSFDGEDAWEKLQVYEYDLVILDRGLPGIEGVEILKRFREKGGLTPVLLLTGKDKIFDRVDGLNSGADDYLTKPFDMRELMARVQALLRRPRQVVAEVLEYRDLRLDLKEHNCFRDGEKIDLLPKEFSLLELLIRNQEQVFSPDQLLDRVWTSEDDVSIFAIRQCVKRLRTKIDRPGEKSYVTTVIGVGYKVERQ